MTRGVGVRDERKKRERMRVRIIRMHHVYRKCRRTIQYKNYIGAWLWGKKGLC